MSRYPFAEIEKRWQDYWEREKTFSVSEDPKIPLEKRRYILDMFPYPSASGLHVGHPEGYTATDIFCRFLRMKGYHVLHPMGFDAFGLPAENYALKTGTHPALSTADNIKRIRKQIKALGYTYDWEREVSTCEPQYYRWTQWLFLQLFKKGLAYEAHTAINWCDSCLTGLANEEVLEGRCERCGGSISQRKIRQWMLRITAYAERLLDDLDDLSWPESVKQMQKNWIGRSQGASVFFPLVDRHKKQLVNENKKLQLTVYTTRPDTLFGASYMVVAPEHPLLELLTTAESKENVRLYCEQAQKKSDLQRSELNKSKTGVFTGSYALNPVNNELLPVWVADYVLISYGSGAIMAVPGHDQRDWEFAQKFNLPIREVIQGGDLKKEAYTGDGKHVNSSFLNSLNNADAQEKMITWLEEKKCGERKINYRLRDWVFSRQRYWGEPIPLVHCSDCGVVALKENELPLLLPDVQSYQPSSSGESPLAKAREWLECSCPHCGKLAHRETNTMPQWAGSCWYYLRYLDPHNDKEFVSPEKERYWMPVDLYLGGAEHAVLHLLYARFWHKVFFDLGLVSEKEPFSRLVNQGMILGEMEFYAFRDAQTWVSYTQVKSDEQGYFYENQKQRTVLEAVKLEPKDVEKSGDNYVLVENNAIVVSGRSDKMSKSRGNVLNPDDLIAEYGADSFRVYEMFMGPLTMAKPWSTGGLAGVHRFLNRLWLLSKQPLAKDEVPAELISALHRCIKKVSIDTEKLSFNTAIATMMSFLNELPKDKLYTQLWNPFVRLLSPYAPHLAEELWLSLNEKSSVANKSWPEWDEELCLEKKREIVFQVNGKLRSKKHLHLGLSKEELLQIALEDQGVQPWITGKTVVREIVISDRLVNLVVR